MALEITNHSKFKCFKCGKHNKQTMTKDRLNNKVWFTSICVPCKIEYELLIKPMTLRTIDDV